MEQKDLDLNLWQRYRKSDSLDLKNKLILQYIWLVKYVLQSMTLPINTILNEEDFLSIGILGLHESIERFQPERGIKFESYAIPRIRGIIQDELRRLDWLSRTARKKAQDLIKAGDALRSQVGREVTPEEIRKKLDISPEDYNSYLAAAAAAKATFTMSESTQAQFDDEERDFFEDIPDPNQENTQVRMENEERVNFIQGFLKKLTERKRIVMTLYYYENLNFKEIGKLLNVSESRVCQIHSQVVDVMRQKLIEFDHS